MTSSFILSSTSTTYIIDLEDPNTTTINTYHDSHWASCKVAVRDLLSAS